MQAFEELYWGRLAIVESGGVVTEMVAFRNALDSLVSAKSDDQQAKARETLQDISLDLAHACRDTSGASAQSFYSKIEGSVQLSSQMIIDSIKKDGFLIRVPASKLFYLFVRRDIDTAKATVAG